MLENTTTRMLLLLLSVLILGLFIAIVLNPHIITTIYNDIFAQQIESQKSAETIWMVIPKC